MALFLKNGIFFLTLIRPWTLTQNANILLNISAFNGYQSFVFEGNNVQVASKSVDGVTVNNGQATTVVMIADNVGETLAQKGFQAV